MAATAAQAVGQSAERVVASESSSQEESRRAKGEAIGRQSSGDCADPSFTIKDVVFLGLPGEDIEMEKSASYLAPGSAI